MTESLTWHPVAERMPDANEYVLIWYVGVGNPGDWCAGWFDGEQWRDSDAYPMHPLTVTHWAQPKGPQ